MLSLFSIEEALALFCVLNTGPGPVKPGLHDAGGAGWRLFRKGLVAQPAAGSEAGEGEVGAATGGGGGH